MAIAATLVLGTAVAAFADTSTGQGLAISGNNCAGSVIVQPQQYAEESGSATQHGTDNPASVKIGRAHV